MDSDDSESAGTQARRFERHAIRAECRLSLSGQYGGECAGARVRVAVCPVLSAGGSVMRMERRGPGDLALALELDCMQWSRRGPPAAARGAQR